MVKFFRRMESGVSRYILNSLLVTTVSVILILIITIFAAFALARMKFPGRTAIYILLVAGFAIPIHTVLVPLRETLQSFKLLDSYPGLILPYVAFGIPFSIILLYPFFLEFPGELLDAARLDGCNTWQLLSKIVLPLSSPGITSVAIFQGVSIWNDFLLALIVINNDKLKTLPQGIVIFYGSHWSNWATTLAALTIATLPLFALYIILQRQFIVSLTGFSK